MLRKIDLEWVFEGEEAYTAKLGEHQVARIFRGNDTQNWAWFVSQCDGNASSQCQYASNLVDCKKAVESAIERWFSLAGLMIKEP